MRISYLSIWQSDCPFISVSEKIQESRLYAIDAHVEDPNSESGMLYIRSESCQSLRETLNTLKRDPRIKNLDILWKQEKDAFVKVNLKITKAMRDLTMPFVITHCPLLIHNGLEKWVIVTKNKKNEKKVLSYLKENNEIHYKKPIKIDPRTWFFITSFVQNALIHPDLFSIIYEEIKLSPTQRKILSRALTYGYYSWPRKITLHQLSGKFGVSKTAIEKSLRKTESKAMTILAELIKLLEERD